MTLDDLLQPVSEEAPCGPDLNETMDPAFDDYYFGALGRLPSYYFRPGVVRPDGSRSPDQVFDAGDVDIQAERREIEPLLARSRDLRLLVLLAQWETLAGRVPQGADAVEAIAALLETFPEAVHPDLSGGPGDRRDAIADLNAPVSMVQPLQFMGLTGTDEVSLRKIKVARGEMTATPSEADLTTAMLNDALSNPANRPRVEALHGHLLRMLTALTRIERACQSNPTAPMSPPLGQITQTLRDMLDALSEAHPDLRDAGTPAADAAPDPSQGAAAGDAAQAAAVPPVAEGTAIAVTGQDHARLILEGCEHYYRRHEPSSAALLLVTQARLLIGRPLTEALQTLLPDDASRALIHVGAQTGFSLSMDRLLQLSETAPQSQPAEDAAPQPAATAPAITSGADAAAAIRSVEDWFRRCERSSPVPVLLQRARGFLDRDFQSLVDDLLPPPQAQ